MKILLLGKNGQVGWELQRALAPLGDLIALDRHGDNGLTGNLADADGLARTVRTLAPQVIINAAAYTAVDKAESEVAAAEAINTVAPAVLAEEAKRLGALLVHYSTDYVFAGDGERAWREDDATGPLSVYGRTKLEGEHAIARAGCRSLVFRTSWVYAARGGNFAKTMLRLARERDSLSVIDDQIGAPTGAELIADVTAQAIGAVRGDAGRDGIYHLAAAGYTSWHTYAQFVLATAAQAGIDLKVAPDAVQAIPSSAYKTAARRPNNSRLDTGKLRAAFGFTMPAWQTGVARMLAEALDK
ncbi:dTDP-4-dehydrorhamnose reductase [Bordetella genomosp. 10]|uniref:dTDP-4-dehydrorhamnose reductase n=1 Tax=Bordetella genomosp. 10 TaxID=1416804 RepID=A0A261S4H1_9BORD|nr:dTDP-4-dehydrorhamnose reductase [Bordetella genomosp. 10]OZI32045.1 dTDP-4-dehydrorhamnose reductase [Bordetella genomosp. 10]